MINNPIKVSLVVCPGNTNAVLDYVRRHISMHDLHKALSQEDAHALHALIELDKPQRLFDLDHREALKAMLDGIVVESDSNEYRIIDSGMQKRRKRFSGAIWENVDYDFIGKRPTGCKSYRRVQS